MSLLRAIAVIWVLLAALCVSSGQAIPDPSDEVIKLLNAATQLAPNERAAAFDAAVIRARVLHDKPGEALGLELSGVNYFHLAAYDKAIASLNAALTVQRELGDKNGQASTLSNLGSSYNELGQPKKALEVLQSALELRQVLGDASGTANTLDDMGAVYDSLSQLDKEMDCYVKALALQQDAKDIRGEATSLNDIGKLDVTLGKQKDAEAAYNKSLTLYEAADDKGGEATVLTNLGFMYSSTSNYSKALTFYNKALPIQQALGDRSGVAWIHFNMGVAYRAQGKNKEALAALSKALAIRQAIGEPGPTAETLDVIGDVYIELGQFATAEQQFDKALAIYRAIGDQGGEATALDNLGVADEKRGQINKAVEEHQKALAIQVRLKDKRGMASTLGNLGVAYDDSGRRAEALAFYQRALPLERELSDRAAEATTLGNIGAMYRDLGDIDQALDNITAAAKIDREIGARPDEASLLNNLGSVLSDVGKPAEALTATKRAYALWHEMGNVASQDIALNNIGRDYIDLGDLANALQSFRLAGQIAKETGDKATQIAVTNNIAEVQVRQGHSAEALDWMTKALALEREIGDRAAEAMTCSNLLSFFEKRNATGLAILNGKLAVNLLQGLRRDAVGVGANAESSYRTSVEPAYRELARLLARQGRLAEAEQVLNLLKDSEFFRFLKTRTATGAQVVNLTPLETTWSQKYDAVFAQVAGLSAEYDALSAVSPSKRTQVQRDRIKAIDARFEACNKALDAYFAGARDAFAKTNASPERLSDLEAAATLTGVLKMLPGHPAAIYTLVTEDGVHLLLNLPNGSVFREPVKNLPAADLSEKIVKFRQALLDPRVDPRPLGAELYELLIRPIEQDLLDAHIDTLMWSLDSRLRYIPIWALFDSKTGKYLLEKYPCSLFTPRTVERQTRDAHGADWTGVEFGVSNGRKVGALAFEPLPGVPNELKAVAEEVGGEPKLDAGFTKDALEDALAGKPKVVHIATHFNFVPGDDTDSFLLLGSGQLSVSEFKSMRNGLLDGVELLTLSACDTADGDIRASAADGGEFESFALLAQLKGADAVLASLWPVSDASTTVLMKEFYRLRKSNPSSTKLEALRQAQIEMMQGKLVAGAAEKQRASSRTPGEAPKGFPAWTGSGFSHPFYWAPFELIGNWK